MKNLVRILLTVWLLVELPSLAHADELWKCKQPMPPVRFAENEAEKELPPRCDKWVKIRGVSKAVIEAISARQYREANEFVQEVAHLYDLEIPEVSTGELHRSPGAYGLETVAVEDAPPGTLLVYNGLAGLMVEVQEEEGGAWERAVLYPSARLDYSLNLSAPTIHGKAEPIAVVEAELAGEGEEG